MTPTKVLAAVVAGAMATAAAAKVQTKEIDYSQGDTKLKGFLAWDDAAKGKRPGVLVVHEWWGLNEHARNQAKRLAKAGYVGFAIDMFGNGKVTTHPKEAMVFSQEATKDPDVAAARFDAALDVLKQQPQVDPEKIADFGYCFGGGVALNMARLGRDTDAVVTFHGALDPWPNAAQHGSVKPAILVLTGGADPFVPKEKVEKLEKEMKDSGAQVKVVTYPGARHGFTNPDAGKAGMEQLKYDKKADQKSWQEAMGFLRKVFGA